MKLNQSVTRQLIHDENEMINQRMNWFLMLQGLMFAGIAFAWEKNSALCVVFSCVGMLSAVSVGILLRHGIITIKKLEQSIEEFDHPVIGRGYKETAPFIHFLLPWHFLPMLMIVAWSTLMCIRLFNIS